LESTLSKDGVYKRRISLSCVSFVVEERTSTYFEYALRENHNGKCGGDPDTSPIVDRYQVYRSSKSIKWLEPSTGEWLRYNPKNIR